MYTPFFLKKIYTLWTGRYVLNSGFTLIELMLYMGLLAIFLLVLTDLLVATLDVGMKSTADSAIVLESEYVRRRIEYDVRRAAGISAPAVGESAQTFTLTIGAASHTYALVDGRLVVTQGGETIALIHDGVVMPQFTVSRIGNGTTADTLRLEYTLESRAQLRGSPAESRTESFTVGGR